MPLRRSRGRRNDLLKFPNDKWLKWWYNVVCKDYWRFFLFYGTYLQGEVSKPYAYNSSNRGNFPPSRVTSNLQTE